MSGVAVVTGASGDLGAAVASRLIASGMETLLVGRNRGRLDAAAQAHQGNPRCVPVVADLTEEDGVGRLARQVAERGRLDVLVLGSGIYKRSDATADLLAQFTANVFGPYALLRSLRPLLTAARGQVAFINSTQGLNAAAGVGQFAATQHAMRAIADSFREESAEDGIRVCSVYLGRTATGRQRDIFALEGRAYRPERLIQPDDVAGLLMEVFGLPRTAEITDVTLRPMLKT